MCPKIKACVQLLFISLNQEKLKAKLCYCQFGRFIYFGHAAHTSSWYRDYARVVAFQGLFILRIELLTIRFSYNLNQYAKHMWHVLQSIHLKLRCLKFSWALGFKQNVCWDNILGLFLGCHSSQCSVQLGIQRGYRWVGWSFTFSAFMIFKAIFAQGPETPVCWPGACQSGQHQSPIDIPHFRNLTYVKHWLPLRWLNYHENYHHLMVTNTGKTVRIDIPRDCGRPRVS